MVWNFGLPVWKRYGTIVVPKRGNNVFVISPVVLISTSEYFTILSFFHTRLYAGLKYEFVGEVGENQDKEFIMSVTIDDKKFEGRGRSKKLAKYRAAFDALQTVYNINCSLTGGVGKNGESRY
jgi:hypothetical protein